MGRTPQMALTTTKISIVFILFIFEVVIHVYSFKSYTGFTLSLIPPISPESPFYQSIHNNLTIKNHERLTSPIWMNHSQPNQSNPSNNILLPMRFRQVYYVTKLRLGDPTQSYTVAVDTGSELSWIQCQPCRHCFPQPEPIYDPSHSRTYRFLPCSHWVCQPRNPQVFRCVSDRCTYDMAYISGSRTKGVASQESFEFSNSNMSIHQLDNIIFGCSSINYRFVLDSVGLAGMLGMNAGPTSFPTQVSSITNGRFSYCLRPILDPDISLLKFGDDVTIPEGHPRQTPLILNSPSDQFQIKLLDIEIGSHRLNIPSSVFALNPADGSGGCFLDTGSMATFLPQEAYEVVKEVFTLYYDWMGFPRVHNVSEELEICYQYRSQFREYPRMAYYFDGAEMPLTVENTYYFRRDAGYFCLPILPSNWVTIIGVVNQQNIRFVYDRTRRMLQFIPANCAADRIDVAT